MISVGRREGSSNKLLPLLLRLITAAVLRLVSTKGLRLVSAGGFRSLETFGKEKLSGAGSLASSCSSSGDSNPSFHKLSTLVHNSSFVCLDLQPPPLLSIIYLWLSIVTHQKRTNNNCFLLNPSKLRTLIGCLISLSCSSLFLLNQTQTPYTYA